jgi:hypothetical protein
MKNKVEKMLRAGMRPKEICKKLGCSPSHPYVVAMRLGIRIRPKKGRQETIADYSREHGVEEACKAFRCNKKQVYTYRCRYK